MKLHIQTMALNNSCPFSIFFSQSGIAGALANLSLGSICSDEQIAYENQHRRANWEAGQIDYLGELTTRRPP